MQAHMRVSPIRAIGHVRMPSKYLAGQFSPKTEENRFAVISQSGCRK